MPGGEKVTQLPPSPASFSGTVTDLVRGGRGEGKGVVAGGRGRAAKELGVAAQIVAWA